ncbi:hypothetical protein AMTR_s00102p00021700 [Amborella trichopoda]|uniref:Uncharacterized protein n=1 Tax=Amborella trichopoda TaxID=13333 RepID=W1NT62_AMBTC|nr:hypothetical protein AMTR_s00102p00021700 [Amborella trichopoda]
MFDAISNGAGDFLTALKSCFVHVSCSSDSGLVLMDQSQLEVVSSDVSNVCSITRYQSEAHGGLELGTGWTSVGAIENGARFLPLLAAHSVTEVPSVCCLRTFDRALTAVGRNARAFLYGKCFEVRRSILPLGAFGPTGAMLGFGGG